MFLLQKQKAPATERLFLAALPLIYQALKIERTVYTGSKDCYIKVKERQSKSCCFFSEDLPTKLKMDMPEDCIHKILVLLPLPSALLFRTVCKRWKSFIFSDAYFSLQLELSCRRRCFLLCTQGPFPLACLYNFILQRWHYLPLPKVIFPVTGPPPLTTSVSHSLFCYANQVGACSVLFVCNPFTRSFRSLPAMPRITLIHKLTLTGGDPSKKTYKIMVAGEEGGQYNHPHIFNLLTEVYDSASDSWTMAGSPSPETTFGSDPGVWCRGSFYCMIEVPYGVVTFDMPTHSWKKIRAPMPACLATPSLVQCQGCVLMVGRMKPRAAMANRGQATDSIRIWKLEKADMVWTEVVKMPDSLCCEFLQPLYPLTPLVCTGIDNFLCITSSLSPQVVSYDLHSSVWSWLPEDHVFPKCTNFQLLGFSLEPRIDILP
ncbi:hypothetical protein O6H91_21G017900 [Diphasiastrum complanatum]|uniref:Uncharacterized protein n=1 Tax=Diphasiastrum complanatum TaxID=34168 RepID=A0ACC2AII2_DIPCM|nr:hypothetical protein O6H91_21G017900 [Diphasiastrum complanatum]